jgi:hypothetical protein
LFASDRDGKIPPVVEYRDGTWSHNQGMNHTARWFLRDTDVYYNLGLLWKYGYLKDGHIFYCPSRIAIFRYEDYSDPVFPSYTGNGVRVSYSYNPICKSLENRERVVRNMADFRAGRSLLLVDVLRPEAVAHVNGWNVAKGDMSVEFVVDEAILEAMEGKDPTDFVNDDYETWDFIMDRMRH